MMITWTLKNWTNPEKSINHHSSRICYSNRYKMTAFAQFTSIYLCYRYFYPIIFFCDSYRLYLYLHRKKKRERVRASERDVETVRKSKSKIIRIKQYKIRCKWWTILWLIYVTMGFNAGAKMHSKIQGDTNPSQLMLLQNRTF